MRYYNTASKNKNKLIFTPFLFTKIEKHTLFKYNKYLPILYLDDNKGFIVFSILHDLSLLHYGQLMSG